MIVGIYGFVNRFLYAAKCLLARSAGADKKIQLPRQQFFFCFAQKTVAFGVIQPFQVGFNSGFSVLFTQVLVLVLFGVGWHIYSPLIKYLSNLRGIRIHNPRRGRILPGNYH